MKSRYCFQGIRRFPAIVELCPAGGTESQDWTEMFFRMYARYAERNNFRLEITDYQDGEEAE